MENRVQIELVSPSSKLGLTSKQHLYLMELQGECRIVNIIYLKINYLKGILLFLLLLISVVGLFLLKYYRKLQVLVFYTQLSNNKHDEMTHVYIEGTDKKEQISSIQKYSFGNDSKAVFKFMELRYQITADSYLPLGFKYKESIEKQLNPEYLKNGLSELQASLRSMQFGKNQHLVEIPNYFQYLFDTMTKPFFIFQYLCSLIYILESVAVFGVLMIVFSFITTSINYALLYFSYKKIKKIAEKTYNVRVLRNNKYHVILNTQLVPGDLFEPQGQAPCDAILVQGQLFVNEVNLTGQNVPIAKFKLEQTKQVQEPKHWIYEGSKILTKKSNTLVMATNIGYGSCKGRIIRKILSRKSKQPQFFNKMIYFLMEVMIISIIVYFATLQYVSQFNIQKIMIIFRFFDFITYSFPAPFPIFFNLAYSFCLIRLNSKDILGTQSEKTVQSSRLDTLCFDKTGTLTENVVELNKIIYIQNQRQNTEITSNLHNYKILTKLFATCHSVQKINSEYLGDEIDLRMFQFTKAQITDASLIEAIRRIEIDQQKLDVLRINQYESKFQSMSVVVRDYESGKVYVFAKGSPQMIHEFSELKHIDFDRTIKTLSLEGFRSIAFSYREVSESELPKLMLADRSQFLQGTKILGIVAFVNKLKSDAVETVQTIVESNIRVKIITGDNIFVAVQTAMKLGIVREGQRVVVVEGQKTSKNSFAATTLVSYNGKVDENNIVFPGFSQWQSDQDIFAVDNAFIKANQQSIADKRIAIYARISPQNKAFIVRKHKQKIKEKYDERRLRDKIFGKCKVKVGMVGDGANDLMAIKESDIGIGISESDAVYSSSFTVRKLMQIDTIIRESKNTEQQIIEMTQYFSLISVLAIIVTICLTDDYSYFDSIQQIIHNFLISLPLTLFIGLSRPAEKNSKFSPESNFMGVENHLIYWGNVLIIGGGSIIAYYYYVNTDDFVSNPISSVTFDSGWSGESKGSTIFLGITNIYYSFLPILLARSKPWKESYWKNIPLFVLTLLDIIFSVSYFFITSSLSFLNVLPIGLAQASIVFGIMIGTIFIGFLYNLIVQSCGLHEGSEISTKL